jgi:hypothetical protein
MKMVIHSTLATNIKEMDTRNFTGWFLDQINKTLSKNREYFYKLSEQSDKIIVWLVGFSITSIALSISKAQILNAFIPHLSNYILIFGSFTVIFGVLYRIFLYVAQSTELFMLVAFEGYVEEYNNPPSMYSGRKLTNDVSYDDVVSLIKEDFDVEIKKLDISNLDSAKAEILRKSTIDYYQSLNNWASEKFERETNEIKNVLSSHLGYSKRKLAKIFDTNKSNKITKKLYWISLRLSQFFLL